MRVLFGCIGLAVSLAASAAPTTVMHQGRLLDTLGQPISGSVTLDITFWDAESGGTALWTAETVVSADDGYYGVLLGSGAMDPVTASVFATDAVWLGVAVNNAAEMPRTPISSVPYALEAQQLRTTPATAAPSMLQGIEGSFTKCGRNDNTSAGCIPGESFPAVCLRSSAEYAANEDFELFSSDFITPAGYWAGSEWRGTQRGSGGPCANGILSFTPARSTSGKATRTRLHYCGRTDGTSPGCRFPEDGWPVICLRTDTSREDQRGGFMVVQAHFASNQWRGVGRGSGGQCTNGVFFWDWDE